MKRSKAIKLKVKNKMKIIEHFTLAQNCVTDLDKDINDAIKEGYEIYGEFQSTDEGLVIQRMVKYETEKTYLNMPPETVSYFEKLEDDDLSKLKFKLYVSDKSIESYQKENEKLKKENLLLRETSKPRDNALLSSIDTIEMLDRIIYAFVANNYRYDEEEGYWIVLNNNTFGCNDTARNSFVKIINQIKEKYKNENNN